MGFLKRIFGGDKGAKPYVDEKGIYFYVQCNKCGSRVRVRADKEYDLQRIEGGYAWHKTIVDSKCFQRMQAVVQFDSRHNVTSREIEGGRYLTKDEYDALEKPNVTQSTDESRGFG